MRYVAMALTGAMMFLGACATTEVQETDLAVAIQAIKNGDLVTAEQRLNAALANDPGEPFANLNMGLVKSETGRRDEAVSHYQTAATNGEGLQAQSLVEPGNPDSIPYSGTVKQVAEQNLARLGV